MAGLLELGRRVFVWEKATPDLAYDPRQYRRDVNGDLIGWDNYGDRKSPYGWEIDHYPLPKALGGGDNFDNLRPLHCKSNARHGGLLGGLLGLGFDSLRRG